MDTHKQITSKPSRTISRAARLAALTFAGVLGLAIAGNNAIAASAPEDEGTTKTKKKTKAKNPKHRVIHKKRRHTRKRAVVDPAWPGAPRLYIEAKALAKKGQYARALAKFKRLNMPKSPNVLTYIGFTTRKLGRVEEGIGYYKQALAIKPTHKGANEYLGEAYLQKGDLASAKIQLTKLAGICGVNCEEYQDLQGSIAQYIKQTR